MPRHLIVAVLSASALLAADPNPLTQSVTVRYKAARQNLLETADVMPEADYSFQLTKEQRPFSGWIEHTAMGNYSFCAAIAGEKAPEQAHAAHGATKKEDLVRALRDSFAYCDTVLQNTDDRKALTEQDGKYPVNAMVGLIASLNEHYGNLVGYLRTKGITPPSSAHGHHK